MIPRPKQTVSQDLRDDLLRLIWTKFYAEDPDGAKCFAQDRSWLLKRVVLWPATWLNEKGLSLPADRYKNIFSEIILDAVRHGNTSKVRYRPAWLQQVIQSHFAHHGEKYYEEAKDIRAQAEHALLMLGKVKVAPEPDPVRELAAAAALLTRSKPAKKTREKPQSNLEFNL